MRQLALSGWMHNRVRLSAASLLTKHLLVRWQDGEAAFAERLLDADRVLDAFNWQWVAGSGADAAPYFRIFNPAVQGRRFDPNGSYVRRWVPELAEMPSRWIHDPGGAPADVLAQAGVVLGRTYPRPIVDHVAARARALDAFAQVRAAATSSA
jgi:deoxyribodipyrimidine photo-lyase